MGTASGPLGAPAVVVRGPRPPAAGVAPVRAADRSLMGIRFDYFSKSFLNSAVRSGATSNRSPTIP
jgi:hypothetical protein